MQANNLVSLQRYASSYRSTELHEDLVVVAELQMFTDHHPNMNECRKTIVESSSLVDGKMTFVWLLTASLRARFSTTLHCHSLYIVWS